MKNLFNKYRIEKTDGTPIDPDAQYFVLRLDTDSVARLALATYAIAVRDKNPLLSHLIEDWLEWRERTALGVPNSIKEPEPEPEQEKNEGYKAILWDMYSGKPEFVWENLDTVEQGLKLITSVLDDSHISWKIAPDGYQVVLPDSIPGDQALGTVIRLKKLDHGYR